MDNTVADGISQQRIGQPPVTDTAKRTLASGLVMTFLGEASTNWGYMMAASIVAALPVTVIFVFLQRYFIQGLTAGAVKG